MAFTLPAFVADGSPEISIALPVVVADGSPLSSGAIALPAFESAIIANIYDLSAEGIPSGGVILSGAAKVQEVIPVKPVGGVVLSGAATVQEAIPYKPTGGVILAGTSPSYSVSNYAPSGGVILSGSSPSSSRSVYAPSGGVVLSGAAVVASRNSLFVPSGGVVLGGSAVAYFVPAGYTLTAENPTNEAYEGWAFNFSTFAPSRYKNLPANSMADFKGTTYIANAGGIYALNGTTDVGRPINASITLPLTDFNVDREKKVVNVYVGANTNGRLRLKAKVNRQSGTYYEFSTSAAAPGQVRSMIANPGRGLKGRYWGFTIENIDGTDFLIDSFASPPLVLQRHGA